jgi:hypothetical protein
LFAEYDALMRLGILDYQLFVRKHFPNEKLLLLPSCAVGLQILDQVESAVEEAVVTGSMVNIMVSIAVCCLLLLVMLYELVGQYQLSALEDEGRMFETAAI